MSACILTIDMGNTSTDFGLCQGHKILKRQKCKTAEIRQVLPRVLEDETYSGIAYCSVVPTVTAIVHQLVAQQPKPAFHLNHQNCPGLTLNYPKPQEIGQDRLANAIAAQALYGSPAIVIDMGTAVTFDIVSEAGYEGGIIAPGLEIMTRYLHEQTALLPALNPDDLFTAGNIGKSTQDAMKLGCVVGFSGMIDSLLKRVTKGLLEKSETAPQVILTGGSAGSLLRDLLPEAIVEPDMILLGLAEAYRRNEANGVK